MITKKPLKKSQRDYRGNYTYRGYVITRNYPAKPCNHWKCIAGVFPTKTECMVSIDEYLERNTDGNKLPIFSNIEEARGFIKALNVLSPILVNYPQRFSLLEQFGFTPEVIKQIILCTALENECEQWLRDYCELKKEK